MPAPMLPLEPVTRTVRLERSNRLETGIMDGL
jgi:hypothetical protein